MYVVLTLLTVIPLMVVGQVWRITFFDGAALREQGERQASSRIDIPALRGEILDRAGRRLVVNVAHYTAALDPTVPGFTPQVAAAFFEKLSRQTGRSAASYARTVRQRSSPRYVRLARGLTERQKEALAALDVPGLRLEAHQARRYNYGETAAHLLGYVDADGQGLEGLELHYDGVLQGQHGQRVVRRDRRGVIKAFAGGKVVPPRHGETLVLTIDLIRQTILEEELARGVQESGATWGTAIAMDPHTGAILALANVPTYNPNRAASYSESARRDRAVTDRIEPGSTFKLVTAVAALEQGVISLDDSVETGPGWAVFGGRTMRDTHAYGTIPFREVIALSSNVGVAKTAQKLDRNDFYQYARSLGFGQATWVDLPGEVAGVLKKPSSWSGTTQTSMSIGYEVAVTPLQMVTAYSALANGGLLVRPYVVAERRDMTGRPVWQARQDSIRRAFKRKTAAMLVPAFEQVVENGTATKAQVQGLPVAGKTGTAKKAAGGSYSGKSRATFVGFFPADDPKVALVVVLDEPRTSIYGGTVAAPIFQRTAQRWISTFPDLAQRVAQAEPLPDPIDRPMPDVAGQPSAIAAQRLRAEGYHVDAPDAEAVSIPVRLQYPEAEAPARPNTVVRLTLDDAAAPDTAATVLMPNLTGLSTRQAVFWLAAQGVTARVEGRGRVVGQVPEAGAPLPDEAVLRCR